MSDQIRIIIQEEMKLLNKNDRQFADYLMSGLSKEGDTTLSHATIINWRKHGKAPQTDFLQDMLSVYPANDRRFVFALRMLAAKSPHVWGFDGVVWRLRKDQ
jgi:hypothetical protein